MVNNSQVRLIECPRDAMQGWKDFIPTQKKTEYINSLLKVGFHTLDFGSFVSPKLIPQMADTEEVISKIDIQNSSTKLLAIVANQRGALDALKHDAIDFLGFPFSISPSFQLRNTNSSMEESFTRVQDIHNSCISRNKQLVIYISMGFGNPYGDPYNEEIAYAWIDKLANLDIHIFSLADTIGIATPDQVFNMTDYLIKQLPAHEIGVHLHSTPSNWKPKIDAALLAGCRRFDGALKGFGGCPMADDELVGNMNTELMIPYFEELGFLENIDHSALLEAGRVANEIFTPGIGAF